MIHDKPFRVLSLSGGGMRGSYAAAYLSTLTGGFANRRGVPDIDIGKAFDLIVGTSTGAIIACALAKGVPLSAVVDLYRQYGKQIFRRPLPNGVANVVIDVFKRKRALAEGTSELHRALTEQLGSTTLDEVYRARNIALAITAVELSQHRSWVFKTPHIPDRYYRDVGYSLVDVCLATSAAPIYRSLAVLDFADGQNGYNVFADGGLWANNPVFVAIIEALQMADAGQAIEVYCLGTCSCPAGEQISKNAADRGLVEWMFGGSALELALDAQEFAYDNMARMLADHLDRPCSIVHFPRQPVPRGLLPYLKLDDVRDEAIDALVRQARSDADMASGQCNAATQKDSRLIELLFHDAPAIGQKAEGAVQDSML